MAIRGSHCYTEPVTVEAVQAPITDLIAVEAPKATPDAVWSKVAHSKEILQKARQTAQELKGVAVKDDDFDAALSQKHTVEVAMEMLAGQAELREVAAWRSQSVRMRCMAPTAEEHLSQIEVWLDLLAPETKRRLAD